MVAQRVAEGEDDHELPRSEQAGPLLCARQREHQLDFGCVAVVADGSRLRSWGLVACHPLLVLVAQFDLAVGRAQVTDLQVWATSRICWE